MDSRFTISARWVARPDARRPAPRWWCVAAVGVAVAALTAAGPGCRADAAGSGDGPAIASRSDATVMAAAPRADQAEAEAEVVVAAPPPPVAVAPVFMETDDGPVRGYVVTVDLADPRVEVVVSAGADTPLDHPDAEVVLTPTDAFVTQTGCVVAVNANFFGWKEDASGKKTLADIVGLSVTDGVVVSEPREHGGEGDPAIVFNQEPRARVLDLSNAQLDQTGDVWDGVAGIGGSDTDPTPGTLLVVDGVSHGATARPGPNVRHPRTAAGVDADGDTLILAVIDGRQPGHSVGITLVELADLMIDAGADDALNLDGGGSTALLLWSGLVPDFDFHDPDRDGWLTNRPSDGRYRPVANHLGLRLDGVTPSGDPAPYVFRPLAPQGNATHE